MTTSYYLLRMLKNKKPNVHNYYLDLAKKSIKTKVDLHTKCRVCLENGTISIYNENSDAVAALQYFGDIVINDDDEYPKLLCDTCFEFIKAAMLFRSTAKRSDELLRKQVKEETDVAEILDSTLDSDFDNTDCITYDNPATQKWLNESKLEDESVKIEEKKEKSKHTLKVTCHICHKIINRSYYKEHITMHDPDHKKYVCDVCGKSFRLRCAYHNHSLRHRNDFPYKCTFCPYKGRYAELLKTHMRTHTGDYRYMCTECPARFLFKSNLNSHMLKHKEPQYKCDACKRGFHTKLMLQRHFEADHLGIKNHVCNMCGKAFGYRNAMMKHQRHVHKREKLLFGRMPSYLEAENKKQDGNHFMSVRSPLNQESP
ncbi:zinc finger protein 37 homolog [Achroia grisella]|uniref:zinc finger protein 37 homolog n=1 Tax=Achroia grisella TaxID=688607 RepID=UPI0027D30A26|nr:zinc finger protein 37 homolog [Achroia grisella]